MNTLHIVHGFAPESVGGTEAYVERLIRELCAVGFPSTVVTGSGVICPRGRMACERVGNLEVVRFHRDDRFLSEWFASDSPDIERRFLHILDRLRPDVVHLHHWMRLSRGLVRACVWSKVPCVVTLHDLWATCLKGDRVLESSICRERVGRCETCCTGLPHHEPQEVRRQARLFATEMLAELRAAFAILAPTRALADLVETGFGVDLGIQKLALPPLFADPGAESNDAIGDGSSGDADLRLVFWGHLDPGKGPQLLIEAVRRLAMDGRSVRLDLYGEALDKGFLESLRLASREAQTAGAGRIEFHGRFSSRDLPRGRFDIAVFPSRFYESHSFVVDEAWALGLPVLVPDRGGFPERLSENGVGWLFRPGDPASLAYEIDHLIRNPDELSEMRKRVMPSKVSWETHITQLTEIYRRAEGTAQAQGAWKPPRGFERWGERKRALRETTAERLFDDHKAVERLTAEYEAHRRVVTKLENELTDAGETAEILIEDLTSHRQVVDEQESELCRYREVVRDRENKIAEHLAVRSDRGDQEAEFDKVLAEHLRSREECEAVLGELGRDLEGHCLVLKELRRIISERDRAAEALGKDLLGHRGLLDALTKDLENLIEAAMSIAAKGAPGEVTQPEGAKEEAEPANDSASGDWDGVESERIREHRLRTAVAALRDAIQALLELEDTAS